MRKVIVTCDHCGKSVEENEVRQDICKKDLCFECYDEQTGISAIGCQLGLYMIERWATGGLGLLAEGVALITRTAGNSEKGISKFAVATLKLEPLEENRSMNFCIGHYEKEVNHNGVLT